MKNHWWKILGVLLLVYAIVAGLLIPLKPGIAGVSPSSLQAGDAAQIVVKGYNTNYTDGSAIRAWLRLDSSYALQIAEVLRVGPREIRLSVRIPEYLPRQEDVMPASLIIDDPVNGPM